MRYGSRDESEYRMHYHLFFCMRSGKIWWVRWIQVGLCEREWLNYLRMHEHEISSHGRVGSHMDGLGSPSQYRGMRCLGPWIFCCEGNSGARGEWESVATQRRNQLHCHAPIARLLDVTSKHSTSNLAVTVNLTCQQDGGAEKWP